MISNKKYSQHREKRLAKYIVTDVIISSVEWLFHLVIGTLKLITRDHPEVYNLWVKWVVRVNVASTGEVN
jgi:hypothetical protein